MDSTEEEKKLIKKIVTYTIQNLEPLLENENVDIQLNKQAPHSTDDFFEGWLEIDITTKSHIGKREYFYFAVKHDQGSVYVFEIMKKTGMKEIDELPYDPVTSLQEFFTLLQRENNRYLQNQ